MKRRKILVADLLCGAGGSSTGCGRALAALGLEMELVCVNHWPVAIETHKKNHPEARHYVQDIATVRPHLLVPEGHLDLLMASPTCTHHSVARGGKPTSDQQRSDPWHIVTWFTELRVKRAIIENVWEFTGWGPVDARSGKPVKSRRGDYHAAWIDTIWKLGATSLEWRKLNAANYGGATTRQRYILKIRFDRVAIGWAPMTHAKRSDDLLLFPTLKPWRPAREIIDWSLKGRSIFDRRKPLAPKTLARIHAGAVKFGWPEPFLVILRNHMAAQSVDAPVPAIAARGNHIALAQPVFHEPPSPLRGGAGGGVSPFLVANRTNNAAKDPASAPAPCLTTAPGGGIALVQPIVLSQHNSGAPRSIDEPLPTITTGGAGAGKHEGCARPMLVEPFVATVAHGNSDGDATADLRRCHSIEEPLGTMHAGGGKFAVVEPLILNRNSAPRGEARRVSEPAPTVSGSGGGYLVEPFVLSRQGGGAPRSIEEPTPAQVAKHSHVLVSPYYGSGSGETCHSVEEPLPTVTSKGRFGMVMPVTHADGSNRARDVETDPLPTLTTANRGELAFIAAQFGERTGQAPRVHDIGEPAPTIAATGHINLVEGVIGASRPLAPHPEVRAERASKDGQGAPQHQGRDYDILFRMLEPHELAAAMGFNTDEQAYEFAGTKTEQVRQIGNAVSVEMMEAEVTAIMADAVPRRKQHQTSVVIAGLDPAIHSVAPAA